ncbi:HEAT repeat-containing protein, partial [Toxoplasma gondii RUB]
TVSIDASPCVRLAAAMLIQGSGGVCRGETKKRSLSGDATWDGVSQKKYRGAAGICGDAERAAGRTDGEAKDAREEVSCGPDLWETEDRERNAREDGEPRVREYVWSRCTRDFLIGLLSGQHTERVTGVAFLKRRQTGDKHNEQSEGRCGAERPSIELYQRGESDGTEKSKERPGAPWGTGVEGASGGADGSAQGDRPEARRSRKRKTAAAFASAFASTVQIAGEAGESPFGVAALWQGDKDGTLLDSTATAAELHTAGPMEVSRHLARQLLFQLFKAPLQEQAFQVKGLCRTHAPLVYALAAHVGACACLSEPFGSRVFSGSSLSASEEERQCSGQSCRPGISYVDRCKLGVALFSQVRAEIVAYEKAKRRVRHREARPSSETRDATKIREKESPSPRPFPYYRGSLLIEWQAQLAMSAQLLRPHCLNRDEKLLEEQPLLRRFIVNSIPEEDLLASLQNTAGGAVLQYSYWSFFVSLPSCVTCPSPSPLNTASSQQPLTSRHSDRRYLFPSSLLPACDIEATRWPVVPNSPNSAFSGAQSSAAVAAAAAAPVSPYGRVLELFIREVSRFLDGRRCAAVHALHAYSAAHICHAVLAAASTEAASIENRSPGTCGVHSPEGAGEKRVAAARLERVGGGESAPEWRCGRSESRERWGRLSAAGESGLAVRGLRVRSCTRQGSRAVSEESGARTRHGGAVRHSTPAHRQPQKTPADGESPLRRTEEPEDVREGRKRRCLRVEREGDEGKRRRGRKGPQGETGSEKDGRGLDGSCGERRRGERGKGEESSCQRDEADGVVTLTYSSSPMEEDAQDVNTMSPAESESVSASVCLSASHLHRGQVAEAAPEGCPLPSWLQKRSEAEVDSALFLDVLLPFLLRDARLRRWFSLQLARTLLPLVATLDQQRQLLAGEVSAHEPSEASCADERRERFVGLSASGPTASADEGRRENHFCAAVERPPESARRERGTRYEVQRRSRESQARRVSVEPGESRNPLPCSTENGRSSSPRGPTLRSSGEERTQTDEGRKKTLTRRQKALLEQKAARESGGESRAEREETACTDSQKRGGRNADDSREKQRGDAEESEAASEDSEDETSEEDDLKDEDFQLGSTRRTKRRKWEAHGRGATKKLKGDALSPEKQKPNSTGDSAFERQQELLCKALRQTPVPQCFALSYRGSAPVSDSVGSSLGASSSPLNSSSPLSPSSALTPSFLSLPAFVAALEIVALLRHLPLGREILVGLEGPLHTSGDNSEADRSVSADSREDRKPLDLLAPLPLHGLLMHAGVAFLRALGELLRRRAFQVPGSAAVLSLPEFGADDAVESVSNPPLPLEIFSVGANARSAASKHRPQAPLQALLRQFPRERLTLQRFLFKRALDVFCSLGQLASVYPRQISEIAVLNPTLVEFGRLLEPLSTVSRCLWREAQVVPRTLSLLTSGGSGEERMRRFAASREEQGGEDSPAVQAPPRGHQCRLRTCGISCEVDGTGDRGEVTAGQQSMRGPSSGKCGDSTNQQNMIAGDKAAALKRWRRNIHLILEIYGVVCEHLAFFFSVPIFWERHRACKSSAGKALFARMLARLPTFLEAMFTWVDFFKATSDRLAAFEHHTEGLQSSKDALGENSAARTQEKQDGRQSDHGSSSAKDEVTGLARLSWNSGACVGHAVCDFWQDAVLQGELYSEDKTRRGKTGDEQRDQNEKRSPEPNVELGESRQPVDKKNASFDTTQEVQSQNQRPLWALNRREQTQEPRPCDGKTAVVLVSPAVRNERRRARDDESETDAVSMEAHAVQVLRVLLARGGSGKIQAAKLTSLLGRFLRTFPDNDTVRSLLHEADHE